MIRFNEFIILFTNGRKSRYIIDDFEKFNSVDELEHKTENIIINIKDPRKSFFYEVDRLGEIVNKEPITICNT